MVGTGDDVHYGRPYSYHWQAAAKDWLSVWAGIEAPVMVVYGEYDQFETRVGHKLIVDTVNRSRPGTASFVEIAKASHDLEIFATPQDAVRGEGGAPAPELFLRPVFAWLAQVVPL
jgi:hypothetical protein